MSRPTRGTEAQPTSMEPAPIIVQQGKILDYIDALTQREETPEEYVRQEIAKSLVREYGYEKQEISVEFTLRLGSRRPRADQGLMAGRCSIALHLRRRRRAQCHVEPIDVIDLRAMREQSGVQAEGL